MINNIIEAQRLIRTKLGCTWKEAEQLAIVTLEALDNASEKDPRAGGGHSNNLVIQNARVFRKAL